MPMRPTRYCLTYVGPSSLLYRHQSDWFGFANVNNSRTLHNTSKGINTMLRPVAQPLPSRDPSPFPPSVVDRVNARKSDEHFSPHSWTEIKNIIAENRLEVLKRWPSEVRRYLEWSSDIKIKYGSVQNFVITKRLEWTPSSTTTLGSGPLFDCTSPVPFQSPSDYKILLNDWPYALEPGIIHLIVWLKTRLQSEPVKGDMTPTARYQVESFVQWKFADRVRDLPEPSDRIQWFKNWTALQSVPGLDHVHVLVRDIPEHIVQEWTRGNETDEEMVSKEKIQK